MSQAVQEILSIETAYSAPAAVVVFKSRGCAGCEQFRPHFQAVAQKFYEGYQSGQMPWIRFLVVETGPGFSEMEADRLGVEVTPTTLLFVEGQVVAKWDGGMDAAKFEAELMAKLQG